MQDPFYHKEKRRKKARMLDADAWLDSALFEFWNSIGRGYQRIEDFFHGFRLRGVKRLIVEVISDGASFTAIGAVLMLALALPAFQATASGRVNNANEISVIFLDRYGTEIGRRGIRSDDSYPLDKLPDYFVKATLATEDRRFYDHFGVDVVGTLRALVNNYAGDNGTQGGSSITQQLAKNLFLSNERTWERKIKEAFLAVWLEWHYSKDEILKLYFDRAYMGGGNFGAAAAAEYYFGKKITDVNLAEAAMLAGLFKAPTNYAPTVDLAAARGRANLVLSNLVDAGFMTEGQVAAARRNPATPIDHASTVNSPDYFLDYAFQELQPLIAGTRSSSFTVRTTIDPVLQSYAEDAITSVLREQGEQYDVSQGAMVVTEPNGAIRAMVGGTDYGKSQFNRATSSLRQPGSSFKPFVYAEAIETMGLKPTSVVSGATRCIGDWCPRNYSGNSVGNISLINAFAQSINTVPVNLSIQTGRQPIADLAHKMGVKTDFEVTRSLALGAASLTVLDMVNGYTVFANDGLVTPSYGITRITTARGDVVWEPDLTTPHERVLSEQTVAYMNQMMRAVVTSGTGRRAGIEGVPAVGKTGTTSDYRDAWFAGFTGNYVAAVWLGNDDYHKTKNLTGGLLPTVAWQKFMAYAHTNIEVKPVFGVDFEPKPFVVAEAEGDAAANQVERPPTLKPEAAIKLLDLADALEATLKSVGSGSQVAALAVTAAPAPAGL
ncbi:MAG: penicillin-binding protein [Devosia sp.]|uniref:transglycosylase domain-containing protein n=1 Tax=Devosia sp. 66-22 TaxID=1895753 RepID=UPI0009275B58|nr:transglycosylase domain-containing protein [Devosia sp. 66-22]MBN9345428.1 penicillin-binding protein [Devosia sp.]OJX51450.1 MAG: penicillin-binding protein [Devosia sp. 66-22]